MKLTTNQRRALGLLRAVHPESALMTHGPTERDAHDVFVNVQTAEALERRGLVKFGAWWNSVDVMLTDAALSPKRKAGA